MAFYGGILDLKLAHFIPERKVAFFWLGGTRRINAGSLEVGTTPQRLNLHIAFNVDLPDLLKAPQLLCSANVTPLDFWNIPSDEPSVPAWMPAAAVYFQDPDGNLLEFLTMLPDEPRMELGVIEWKRWKARSHQDAEAAAC